MLLKVQLIKQFFPKTENETFMSVWEEWNRNNFEEVNRDFKNY